MTEQEITQRIWPIFERHFSGPHHKLVGDAQHGGNEDLQLFHAGVSGEVGNVVQSDVLVLQSYARQVEWVFQIEPHTNPAHITGTLLAALYANRYVPSNLRGAVGAGYQFSRENTRLCLIAGARTETAYQKGLEVGKDLEAFGSTIITDHPEIPVKGVHVIVGRSLDELATSLENLFYSMNN